MSKPKKKGSGRASKSRRRISGSSSAKVLEPLLFEKKHYLYMGVGLILIAFGLVLMGGGGMPDPNTWEPERIYSFRRTTLAPIFILAGLVVEIYAIFKK